MSIKHGFVWLTSSNGKTVITESQLMSLFDKNGLLPQDGTTYTIGS